MTVVRIGGEASWEPGQDDAPPGVEVGDEPEAPLVLVTWHDAWFDFEASDPEEARTDYVVTTVGFLVGNGPRVLSVAQEVLPDGEGFRAITHIPLAVVETVIPLRRAEVDERQDQVAP